LLAAKLKKIKPIVYQLVQVDLTLMGVALAAEQ
jgi:hypothetical protein